MIRVGDTDISIIIGIIDISIIIGIIITLSTREGLRSQGNTTKI